MKLIFADIETDGINPSKIHFIRVKTQDGFAQTFFDMNLFKVWVEFYLPDKWVFHNGIAFDVPVINRLVAPLINPRSVIDTFVVSRLVGYSKFITHSLEELGEHVGYKKIKFDGPWDVCTEEMIKYGEQDVEVLQEVFEYYKDYILSTDWAKAMRVEHDMAIICHDMNQNGFTFNKTEAQKLLDDVTNEMKTLEDSFQVEYPPKLVEVNRIQYRTKKDGSLYSTTEEAMSKYPLTKIEGSELVCFDYQAFNPGSPVDRIDVLWDAGWKPIVKTKGFKKFEKDNR
jgi:DNA polymerase III epsilon subunit-like protein